MTANLRSCLWPIAVFASDLGTLRAAAALDWSTIEPAIFGTLFERSLDPGKRSQLGAHYTSRQDILLIVEPVVIEPLQARWQAVKAEALELAQAAEKQPKGAAYNKLRAQMEERCAFLEEVPRIESALTHTEEQLGVYASAEETQRAKTLAEEPRAQLAALTEE